jgi:hypothetical protein
MAAALDPFAALSWRQRVGLRHRLRKAWKAGVADQHADSLARLREDLIGVPVLSADDRHTIGEIACANGLVIRTWLSYRPAMRALAAAAAGGDVALVHAADHGHCWALYFSTLEGRLPLMCRDLRVRRNQGGMSPASRVPAPISDAPLPA